MIKLAKIPPGVGPKHPQILVLVGGTGDLAQRKLWPALFHLVTSGFIPACRMIGVSLDDIEVEGFRELVRNALEKFGPRKVSDTDWTHFAQLLDYAPIQSGPSRLSEAVKRAEHVLGPESRRLHYLSVPPSAV